MNFIVALSIVTLFFSYTEAEETSLKEIFVTGFIDRMKKWADVNVVFNLDYKVDDVVGVISKLIYNRAVKNGMDEASATSDANNVSKAVRDTFSFLKPSSLMEALGYIFFEQLMYGNVVNSNNVNELFEKLSNTFKDTFSKTVTNNIQGYFDVAETFLTPYKLYDAEALKVKDRNIVSHLYLAGGIPPPS